MTSPSKPPRSVLITGCSAGGIGDALAQEFKRRGLRVFATARDVGKMAHLEKLAIELLELDVTDEESAARAAAEVGRRTGERLDILVNNSGAGYMVPITDSKLSTARNLFETNLFSIFIVTSAFMPFLIESRGLVVNNSSGNDRIPSAYHSWYNASKAAVTNLGDSMRLEFAPLGVRVVTIVTGSVKTKFMSNVVNFKEAAVTPTETEAASQESAPAPKPSEYQLIPPTSYYYPLRDVIEKREWMFETMKPLDVDIYAQRVVGDLLGNPSPRIYRGSASSLAWALAKFVPQGWLDGYLRKMSGLNTLEPNFPKKNPAETS
ncbi:NAD(P)-binding protein [Eremomyces bilateralis CBS 781.70]|uniref:NAD(P)-binding protein n=1 Tax=Eremomyces bilateralis CBS 781.70 TaxID=1392243 RepID=A0A6G1G2J8_9PEZI|nr:NAD(P)-binding protein [Eremomyces bilateralis CBS 781.70]KAF1812212.1 NAD(P)-binding protein [Eremomyces bilateralis CBS 781.70]